MQKRILRQPAAVLILLCLFTLAFCPAAYAENEDITDIGDYLQIVLPSVAMLSTFVAGNPEGGLWDREGTYQGIKAIGLSLSAMGIGKAMADKIRPDASDPNSFPSGHTTAAFAGAGFIDQRYGHWWGVPALLAAGFVGYSRVQSYNHYTDDVTAGMSVGLLSNWLVTTPQSESSTIGVLPLVVDGGAGVMITTTMGGDSDKKTKRQRFADPRFRYNFVFGPAYLARNEIRAPSDSGTTFDLADFPEINDPTTTAAVELDFYLGKRHEATLYFSPYESRDIGSFATPVSFDGRLFPADTPINSDWLLYDLRGRWLYNLLPESPWQLKVGASLAYQYMETSLGTADGAVFAEIKNHIFLPLVSAVAGYRFTPRVSAGVEVDAISLSKDSALEAGVSVNYRISDRWDISAGYRYYCRDIDTDEIRNNVIYHIPYMSVAYSWL